MNKWAREVCRAGPGAVRAGGERSQRDERRRAAGEQAEHAPAQPRAGAPSGGGRPERVAGHRRRPGGPDQSHRLLARRGVAAGRARHRARAGEPGQGRPPRRRARAQPAGRGRRRRRGQRRLHRGVRRRPDRRPPGPAHRAGRQPRPGRRGDAVHGRPARGPRVRRRPAGRTDPGPGHPGRPGPRPRRQGAARPQPGLAPRPRRGTAGAGPGPAAARGLGRQRGQPRRDRRVPGQAGRRRCELPVRVGRDRHRRRADGGRHALSRRRLRRRDRPCHGAPRRTRVRLRRARLPGAVRGPGRAARSRRARHGERDPAGLGARRGRHRDPYRRRFRAPRAAGPADRGQRPGGAARRAGRRGRRGRGQGARGGRPGAGCRAVRRGEPARPARGGDRRDIRQAGALADPRSPGAVARAGHLGPLAVRPAPGLRARHRGRGARRRGRRGAGDPARPVGVHRPDQPGALNDHQLPPGSTELTADPAVKAGTEALRGLSVTTLDAPRSAN
ncbi:hypothetical protein SCOCK_110110 [Actinacidiphila cocklensis]|uniref:Uncharacterized protein n=1 Tax=Actinacidiphila cocklensis TaxID=887465 RepID=A0A9W4DJD6_9ACTN|nr:hypothetical protein SCOCK_110110 [Actinacidiphila cocklensis]